MDEPLLVKFLRRSFPRRFVIAKLSRWPIFGRAMMDPSVLSARIFGGGKSHQAPFCA
jgi:hypothetical protein